MRLWCVFVGLGLVAATTGCASRSEGDGDRRMMHHTGVAAKSAVRQTYFGMGEAITSPLRDLNLTRKDIPVVLLAAMDAPYQTRTVFDCPSIAAEVASLDLALGPDLDTPRDRRDDNYYALGADEAAEAALDAVRDAAEGIVPVRSWVRRLSGAQRNDKRTKESIYAGSVRRAFLKGLGDHRGCPYPAAPMPPSYAADGTPSAQDAAQETAAATPPA